MWPRLVSGDPNVDAYCERVRKRRREIGLPESPFRDQATSPQQEKVFSSSHARDLVEKAFLKVGAHLVMATEKYNTEGADSRMRPLGYEKLRTLGFGSLFVTYRNIANNCPLALCYGNPEYSLPHPLGLWYPLFPRKITEGDINWINVKLP